MEEDDGKALPGIDLSALPMGRVPEHLRDAIEGLTAEQWKWVSERAYVATDKECCEQTRVPLEKVAEWRQAGIPLDDIQKGIRTLDLEMGAWLRNMFNARALIANAEMINNPDWRARNAAIRIQLKVSGMLDERPHESQGINENIRRAAEMAKDWQDFSEDDEAQE